MCRMLAYIGEPATVDDLLFQPDSSLVKQSFMPRMLRMLNLAGFGMIAWDDASYRRQPFRYTSTSLPIFDRNLKNLAEKIQATCMLAHVRGVADSGKAIISPQNVHPFYFEGAKLAMAHNGDLFRFAEMKYDLLPHVKPEIARLISGTTDSEWIYATLLSQLEDPTARPDVGEIKEAVERTFAVIRDCRRRAGIDTSSSVNLVFATGRDMCAVRFCFDFGRYPTAAPDQVTAAHLNYVSLWYTSGREFGHHEGEWKMIGGSDAADSIIVASEPSTRDTTSWLEVPEYSMIYARTEGGQAVIETHPLDV